MSENKVRLPKEVAGAVSHFFTTTNGIDFPVQAIMKVAMENERYISNPDHCDAIKEYVKSYDNLKTLMSALVNGYEVEETPEDKVREYYKDQVQRASSRDGSDHISPAAIRMVLDLLSIKISGVNVE